MSHAAAEACTQRLDAGRGTGIGLQHVNDDHSAQHDKPLDGSSGINKRYCPDSGAVKRYAPTDNNNKWSK